MKGTLKIGNFNNVATLKKLSHLPVIFIGYKRIPQCNLKAWNHRSNIVLQTDHQIGISIQTVLIVFLDVGLMLHSNKKFWLVIHLLVKSQGLWMSFLSQCSWIILNCYWHLIFNIYTSQIQKFCGIGIQFAYEEKARLKGTIFKGTPLKVVCFCYLCTMVWKNAPFLRTISATTPPPPPPPTFSSEHTSKRVKPQSIL